MGLEGVWGSMVHDGLCCSAGILGLGAACTGTHMLSSLWVYKGDGDGTRLQRDPDLVISHIHIAYKCAPRLALGAGQDGPHRMCAGAGCGGDG